MKLFHSIIRATKIFFLGVPIQSDSLDEPLKSEASQSERTDAIPVFIWPVVGLASAFVWLLLTGNIKSIGFSGFQLVVFLAVVIFFLVASLAALIQIANECEWIIVNLLASIVVPPLALWFGAIFGVFLLYMLALFGIGQMKFMPVFS